MAGLVSLHAWTHMHEHALPPSLLHRMSVGGRRSHGTMVRMLMCWMGRWLSQIESDKLTRIAAKSWSASGGKPTDAKKAFSSDLVTSIYNDELGGKSGASPALRKIMVLEISQYLESYLWPNFGADTASFEHIMSIILMVNEKFRENVPAWACFHSNKVC